LVKIIVGFVRFLDNHDLLPSSLTKGSIYHSTVLLSNLGSIHCDGIYHNLTNFGTNSIVVTIGEIKEEAKVIDGKVDKRYICQFGVTLDERIADGVYFAKCVNLLAYILDNPSLLEGRVNDKIDMGNNK
jgi:pyruvate/2-oxoglutarate dehydrogenase complex dihydrolipoamide acyltransferase (E2) component